MTWLVATRDGVVLAVHVQPGAKQTAIVGPHGDALKIRLAAPPVDGKANAALLDFLAKRLDVTRDALTLVAGAAARSKRVRIDGLAASTVLARLWPAGTADDKLA